MPRRSGEKPSDLPAEYVDIAGRLAAEFAAERDGLSADLEQQDFGLQKDRLLVMADKLIVLVNKGLILDERETSLPTGYAVDELVYLSFGYMERQRAAVQNIEITEVKSRLIRLKKILGTQTRPETVAIGIQNGFIPIRVRENPNSMPLSWMQKQILSYSADGWSAAQIAAHYDITSGTVDRYYEEIRAKLGATNMPQAVRRAFEFEIFKIGEPIREAGELNLDVKILVQGIDGQNQSLRVADHRQIGLLRTMVKQNTGWISSEKSMEEDFYSGVSSTGRQFLFGRMMLSLGKKLEAAAGKPMLHKRRLRINEQRTYLYVLTSPLELEINGERCVIPAYPEEEFEKDTIKLIKAGAQKPREHSKPKAKRPKKTNTPEAAARPQIRPEAAEQAETESAVEEPEEIPVLPPLDEAALRGLGRRVPSEVLENNGVKTALDYISRRLTTSYRAKVILALRYGIPKQTLCLASINRGGENIKLADIAEFIPPYQGLDVESASVISGISPIELLEAENQFIKEFSEKFPALQELEPIIRRTLKELTKV